MSPRTALWLKPLSCLALLSVCTEVHAHGGFPRMSEIIVEPGNPEDVVLRSDVWGFLRTQDGGRTWQWTCSEVYGSSSLSVNHSHIVIAPGGRVLVANAFKGLRLTDDFCTWRAARDLDGEFVGDVVLANGGVAALTATYRGTMPRSGIDGHVWQSSDNGDHFTRVGPPLPETFAGSSLRFAPSAPRREYIAGRIIDMTGGTVLRSSDGGETWLAATLPITDDSMTLRIVGVHPTRPDVVFLWGDLSENLGADAPDELWGSADGGKTWSLVYQGAGDLPGFAFSPDGTEVAIAGPLEGVRRALVDDALTEGQAAFAQAYAGRVWGLHWTAAGLAAGNDDFTAMGVPSFSYGRSLDEGASFEPLMDICQVKYDACGPSSSVATACNSVYDDLAGGFSQDFTNGVRCVREASSGGDAGAPPSSPPGTGGTGSSASVPPDAGSGDSAAPTEPAKSLRITQGCAIERAASSASNSTSSGAGLLALLVVWAGRRLRPRPEP